jgi:ribosomal RNA-processing protein 1
LIGEKLGIEKQKEWFEQFLYIFNLHWDKVDNYRIDKYLMFIRFQLNEVLHFLKKHDYDRESVLNWFNEQMKGVFLNENEMSKGIPLQICDTFLQELNKVDAENISFANIAALLEPFLHTFANMKNTILLSRLEEKIFAPLLDNNITPDNKSDDEDTDDSSSEINYDPKSGKKWVDGGKLHPKTFKEV